jgi:hypothetical protein
MIMLVGRLIWAADFHDCHDQRRWILRSRYVFHSISCWSGDQHGHGDIFMIVMINADGFCGVDMCFTQFHVGRATNMGMARFS